MNTVSNYRSFQGGGNAPRRRVRVDAPRDGGRLSDGDVINDPGEGGYIDAIQLVVIWENGRLCIQTIILITVCFQLCNYGIIEGRYSLTGILCSGLRLMFANWESLSCLLVEFIATQLLII